MHRFVLLSMKTFAGAAAIRAFCAPPIALPN
jgi:hypothetical protein